MNRLPAFYSHLNLVYSLCLFLVDFLSIVIQNCWWLFIWISFVDRTTKQIDILETLSVKSILNPEAISIKEKNHECAQELRLFFSWIETINWKPAPRGCPIQQSYISLIEFMIEYVIHLLSLCRCLLNFTNLYGKCLSFNSVIVFINLS